MPDYEPQPENAEEYFEAKAAYDAEEAIWNEKMPGAQMGIDVFELGVKFNVLITYLVNSEVVDSDIFNTMVYREMLLIKQTARAKVEEQVVRSNVVIAPGYQADRFKRRRD